MSIKGGAYRWLRAALERGDLAGARSAAAELGRINLADAASVVVLMAAARDPAYERAAVRWLARLAAEKPSIALEQFASAAAALAALPGTAHARAELAAVCARQNITGVIGLIDPADRRVVPDAARPGQTRGSVESGAPRTDVAGVLAAGGPSSTST